jgi:hypothetical protein
MTCSIDAIRPAKNGNDIRMANSIKLMPPETYLKG